MTNSGGRNEAESNPQSLISNLSHVLDAELRKEIDALLPKYPSRQAATLPALHLINEKLGYVPQQAVVELAELLGLAPAQVQDTLSFYGIFRQDKPMGKYRISVCQ
jgi:NADH-quinone oxidoreductase subunit E